MNFLVQGCGTNFRDLGMNSLQKSPWNEYSSSNSIPVLVDRDGNFHGYFTINEYRSDAVEFASEMSDWYDEFDGNLEKARIRLCNTFGKSG